MNALPWLNKRLPVITSVLLLMSIYGYLFGLYRGAWPLSLLYLTNIAMACCVLWEQSQRGLWGVDIHRPIGDQLVQRGWTRDQAEQIIQLTMIALMRTEGKNVSDEEIRAIIQEELADRFPAPQ